MKNIMNKFLKSISGNQRGFSLVEIIMAIGVLGIGGYVLLNTTSTVTKQEKVMTVNPVVSRLNLNIVGKAKRILTELEDQNGAHTQGICQMVSSTASSPGVGPVFITLFPKTGNGGFPTSRWNQYIGDDWNASGPKGKECEANNNYQKCYTMKDDTNLGLSDKKTTDLNVVLSVQLIPMNMNPLKDNGGKMFQDLSGNTLTTDIKDIGFKIVSKVTYNVEADRRVSKIYDDFIWAPAVGSCDYTLPKGTKVKLSLSGAGASDPNGSTVYNRSGFAGNKQDPLQVIFRKTQVQKGKLTNNGQFLQSDTNANIFGSCNETRYRCPQEDHSRRDYGRINIAMNLTYFPDNKLVPFFASQMTMIPKVVMEKNDQNSDLISGTGSKSAMFFDGRTYNYRSTAGEYYFGNTTEPLVVNGSHVLQVAISDSGNANTSNNLCRRVCTKESNYNTTGTTYVDQWSPYLSYKFKGYDDQFKLASNQGFGCTACYMKGCDRLGLETFGPMAQQPYQPLDSGLPECSMKEGSSVLNEINPYKSFSKDGSGWTDGNKKCIAARLSYDQSSLTFTAEDCDSSLPVMCFNFGKFILARDIAGGNESLAKVPFKDASKRCFNMGKETINKAALDEYLGSTTLPFPQTGSQYSFINVAEQGTFVAPQIQKDVKYYNEWRMQNGIAKDTKFWVNMKKDSGKNMVASVPFMSAGSKDNFGVYFDGNGVLTYRKYPSSLGLKSASGTKGLLLFHHVKFKGAVAVDPTNPSNEREFPFLCRKSSAPYQLFLSDKTSSKQSRGHSACSSEGGKFLPPTTSLGWVKAFFLVAENHRNYPYPDPRTTSASSVQGAWVALQDRNDRKGWALMDFDRIKDIGDTSNYEPQQGDKVKILDGVGRYINPRAMVTSDRISGKNVDIPAKGTFKVNIENTYTVEVTLNSHETDIKKMKLQDVADKFNDSTSRAIMRVNKVSGNKGDARYKLVVESKSTDVDSMVEIMGGTSNSALKFQTGDKGTAPNTKKLCWDNSGYSFEQLPKSGYCKNELTVDSIKDGLIYGILWELGGYSAQQKFVFNNN